MTRRAAVRTLAPTSEDVDAEASSCSSVLRTCPPCLVSTWISNLQHTPETEMALLVEFRKLGMTGDNESCAEHLDCRLGRSSAKLWSAWDGKASSPRKSPGLQRTSSS